MREYSEGAYFVSRRSRRAASRKRRGAGVLVLVLIILTAGICLLVVFLPRMTVSVGADASFKGKTFYFLSLGEFDGYVEASEAARATAARGGAGYVYNDGKYRIIAAAYEREADAAALASVNDNAEYFAVEIPAANLSDADGAAMTALVGDYFTSVFTAATELDRGNATEAAAESAAISARRKLLRTVCDGDVSGGVSAAIEFAADFSVLTERPTRSTLSCLRYISVRGVVAAADALGG